VRVRVRVDHGEENRDPRRREQDVDLVTCAAGELLASYVRGRRVTR
jgi:hypothetical protein